LRPPEIPSLRTRFVCSILPESAPLLATNPAIRPLSNRTPTASAAKSNTASPAHPTFNFLPSTTDEIWSFVGAKDKNVPIARKDEFGIGSAWTSVAIDADSKMICSWLVGKRDSGCATEFIQDLAGQLKNRVQLTTDGLKMYLTAVADGFGSEIDYAMIVKIYGNDAEGEKRYSPAVCTGCKKETKIGNPDERHVSTSYIERQNLTMRTGMRRFTRLTNAFSKKIENHVAAIALHYMYYNYCRIHQTLRITPAMAAGVTDRLWSIQDIVGLLD
jgi:IS1 family transposase